MPDQFSISNLLSLLQVDRQHAAIKLCTQAEGLRRRRHYAEAIRVADSAAQMAHNDYSLIGITLLYLSHMRLASHVPHEEALAIRDCDRAIRSLSVTPFNQAIANLIRAQIELRHPNDEHRSILVYLDRADKILERLIKTEHEHHRLNQLDFYKELRQHIARKIDEVSSKLVEVPPIVIAAKQAPLEPEAPPEVEERPAPEVRPVPEKPVPLTGKDRWRKLLEETQLIWPEPEPIGWQLAPFVTIAGPEPKPTGPALDYIEITQVTIQGQPYAIEPLYSDGRSLRLQAGQSYIPLQVVTDGGPYYALVRRQDHIDAAEQFAVMRGKDRVWTAHLPEDTSDAVTYTDRDIRIIGVIEAVLTPLHAAA